MCNRYRPGRREVVSGYYQLVIPERYPEGDVYPRGPGAFIRRGSGGLELAVGPWGLVPVFAKSPSLPYATNNARSESVAEKATFRQPWAKGQRCVIPVERYWEPNWETGRNIWWSFERADGELISLAGLWNTWVDRSTGEVVESYTMLTVNADQHPLMRRMHKPDPKLPQEKQDKRSVVVLERGDLEQWLSGSVDDARGLLRVPGDDVLVGAPEG